MQLLRQLVALLAGMFLYAGMTQADDYWIPDWRGQPGTTWAVWDNWTSNPQPMPPDHFAANPPILASPTATADINSAFLMDSWTDTFGDNRWNVLHIVDDDALGFYLDNFDLNAFEKEVQVQITFDSDHAWPKAFYVTAGYPEGEVSTHIPAGMFAATEPPGWVTAAYEFSLQPNPSWEKILLEFAWEGTEPPRHSAYVDQVVIDTRIPVEVPPGDFDIDSDVDGTDFLIWERGDSPDPLSVSDLADWKAHFGTVGSLPALSSAVPEPTASSMLIFGIAAMLFRCLRTCFEIGMLTFRRSGYRKSDSVGSFTAQLWIIPFASILFQRPGHLE